MPVTRSKTTAIDSLRSAVERHGDRTTEQRHELGGIVRNARRSAEFSLIALASDTGIHFNRLSRIERGEAILRKDELTAILKALDIDAPSASRIFQLIQEIDDDPIAWQLPDSLHIRSARDRQDDVNALLDTFTDVKGFFPAYIPTHLRTREYARYAMERGLTPLGASRKDIEMVCNVKADVQEMLYDTGRTFEIVLHEAAFFVTPAPPHVMASQAEKVVQVSLLKNVKIGIVPLGTPMTCPALHEFFLFDESVLHLELAVGHVDIMSPRFVSLYGRLFDLLRRDAMYGTAARDRLSHIAGALDRPVRTSTDADDRTNATVDLRQLLD